MFTLLEYLDEGEDGMILKRDHGLNTAQRRHCSIRQLPSAI